VQNSSLKVQCHCVEMNRKDTTFAGDSILLSLASQLRLKASLINKVLNSSYARCEKAVVLVCIDQYHKIINEDTRSICSTI